MNNKIKKKSFPDEIIRFGYATRTVANGDKTARLTISGNNGARRSFSGRVLARRRFDVRRLFINIVVFVVFDELFSKHVCWSLLAVLRRSAVARTAAAGVGNTDGV